MLPVSYEVAQAPLIQIDRNHAPPIPPHDSYVSHIAIDIVVRIVNIAVHNAQRNPLRMAAFNLLSQNGWHNPLFKDVFDLCVGNIMLSARKGSASPDAVMARCVDDVMSLYSSSLIYEYPELRNVITMQLYDSSVRNAAVLHELKKEIYSMQMSGYRQPVSAQPGLPVQIQSPNGQAPQYVAMVDPTTGQVVAVPVAQTTPTHVPGTRPSMVNVGMVHGQFNRQGMMGEQYSPAHHNPYAPRPDGELLRPYRAARSEQPDAAVKTTHQPPVGYAASLKQGDYFESHRARHTRQAETPKYEPEVVTTAAMSVAESLPTKEKEVSHMEHSATESPVCNDKTAMKRFLESDDSGVVINGKVFVHLDLADMLNAFRGETVLEEEYPVCRKHGILFHLVVSSIDVSNRVRNWINQDNLTQVALALQAQVANLSAEVENTELLLSVIREIDNYLTVRVNDFMLNMLGTEITIDSVIDDYPKLPDFIMRKFGSSAKDILLEFDAAMLHVLQCDGEPIDHPTGVHVVQLPSSCTITAVPFDRLELGLKLTRASTEMNQRDNAVVLKSVKNLFNETPVDDIFGSRIYQHYLVTRDGAFYRVTKPLNSLDSVFLTLV